eukprot:2439780-Heterocapsa_arctica.AAC.1
MCWNGNQGKGQGSGWACDLCPSLDNYHSTSHCRGCGSFHPVLANSEGKWGAGKGNTWKGKGYT